MSHLYKGFFVSSNSRPFVCYHVDNDNFLVLVADQEVIVPCRAPSHNSVQIDLLEADQTIGIFCANSTFMIILSFSSIPITKEKGYRTSLPGNPDTVSRTRPLGTSH